MAIDRPRRSPPHRARPGRSTAEEGGRRLSWRARKGASAPGEENRWPTLRRWRAGRSPALGQIWPSKGTAMGAGPPDRPPEISRPHIAQPEPGGQGASREALGWRRRVRRRCPAQRRPSPHEVGRTRRWPLTVQPRARPHPFGRSRPRPTQQVSWCPIDDEARTWAVRRSAVLETRAAPGRRRGRPSAGSSAPRPTPRPSRRRPDPAAADPSRT